VTSPDVRWARVLAGAHLGQAVVLLAQPPGVLRGLAGDRGVPPAGIVRVLGARLLVQAAPEALCASRTILRLGVVVDVVHAASMLAAARVWPRYRRVALVSAGSAAVSALAGAAIVRGRR
jgi:hypothetical protein